ncbi:MAG: InlB B-repeat-containing protein [Bacteroidales bacterium]|nr:InlB B-repeat-containing protein [Bacteroidales bacterium]
MKKRNFIVAAAILGTIALFSCKKEDSSFTVTYNGNGNTGGTVPVDNTIYEEGATVTVLDNTGDLVKTGHTFGGWCKSASGTTRPYFPSTTFSITEDITFYAIWMEGIDISEWKLNPANNHYYASISSTNWSKAEEIAETFGGTLVIINDEAENNWIISNFGDVTNDFGYNALHIGYTDAGTEGIWVWVDGSTSTYTNWGPEAPGNDTGYGTDREEDYCQVMVNGGAYEAGLWNDINDLEEYPGLIETAVNPE